MTIKIRRVAGKPGKPLSAFYEASFAPPKGHAEGDFEIRVFDDVVGTPYRRDEPERRGAFAVRSDSWIPMNPDGLWKEEAELFQALLERIEASKKKRGKRNDRVG